MHTICVLLYYHYLIYISNRTKIHDFKLQILIHRIVQDPDVKVKDAPLTPAELKEYQDREEKLKNFIANMRLELAKVNREVLRYSFAIDEVPGTAELLQYEKRFIELYNQGKLPTIIQLYTDLFFDFFFFIDLNCQESLLIMYNFKLSLLI